MNRCAQFFLRPALACAFAALAASASAQTTQDGQTIRRNFPQSALRGQIVFGDPPVITMNGVVTRMAIGYRVHGQGNLLVMSAQLDGLTATVDYTRDVEGHVYEVWILSPTEIAQLWPQTPAQAAAWTFDPVADTWTKP